MKTWKTIFRVTSSIGIIFLISLIGLAIYCYTANIEYPYPALGIDIFNWIDKFSFDLILVLYVTWLPLVLNLILFIISAFKIKLKSQ